MSKSYLSKLFFFSCNLQHTIIYQNIPGYLLRKLYGHTLYTIYNLLRTHMRLHVEHFNGPFSYSLI
jgi:hypothetical protein